ncbi:hypothetical protein H1C71_018922 [Ictidomys tridecemlineatus]|nr:hypothetical protein H1C71_018922 [Ictidomys tridecemlineatus]KAG3273534.1 hypothetical protein H1C71_018922 [Ictidomys tridecemlineatus]KAG3273535.1 hypothetical protein H1C71_018922 [Ictidomys tridecemlineatus]
MVAHWIRVLLQAHSENLGECPYPEDSGTPGFHIDNPAELSYLVDHCCLWSHTEELGGRPYPGNCATKESFHNNQRNILIPWTTAFCCCILKTWVDILTLRIALVELCIEDLDVPSIPGDCITAASAHSGPGRVFSPCILWQS